MTNSIPDDCVRPDSARIEPGVSFGRRVVLAGDGIVIRSHARLDAACVIGEAVTVGQGAWVRAGAVVLRSVPPNAIVEGNPAQVVGYRNGTEHGHRPDARVVDVENFLDQKRPARVALGVGRSALFLMRRVVDTRGGLTVGEVPSELPFSPARYFAVFDVPSVELRGEHAHKRCEQFLVCLHGSCRVLLDDGSQRCEVTLDRPDVGIYMPEMIWGTQYRYSHDAVLLVFASRPYEVDDYLRTYDEFLAELKERSA
jgi:hypothetical protein